jgi:hypothetical protein
VAEVARRNGLEKTRATLQPLKRTTQQITQSKDRRAKRSGRKTTKKYDNRLAVDILFCPPLRRESSPLKRQASVKLAAVQHGAGGFVGLA